MELVRRIADFPSYSVSNTGRVFNDETGHELQLSPVQNGDLTVGLVRDGHQSRYSVKCLVARAFVEGETDVFNTPIQLDGNKNNLDASNIVWRPRWFAWKYTHQFKNVTYWSSFGPIYDLYDGTQYMTILDAASANGILCRDILYNLYDQGRIFPTWQNFRFLE